MSEDPDADIIELARQIRPTFVAASLEVRRAKEARETISLVIGPLYLRIFNGDPEKGFQKSYVNLRMQGSQLEDFDFEDDASWERMLKYLERDAAMTAASHYLEIIEEIVKLGASNEMLEKFIRETIIKQVMST